LASQSRYRRGLLERLGLQFEVWTPNVDEAPLAAETPRDTAARLARAKAEAGRAPFPTHWIIGSDQVAEVGSRALGKPGTLANARAQLREMSGKSVLFHTGLCLASPRGAFRESLVTTEVAFRTLTEDEIERYLAREPSLDCAGSAKIEALGIALLERLRGDDPTALIGLPLIALGAMLRAEGFEIP
jgi:septum formation protein